MKQAAAEADKEADELLSSARSKAERILAESAARATAINDGAARRLELLAETHAKAARRLTQIRDVVTELLNRDSAKGSLEDEVANAVAMAMGAVPAEPPRSHDTDQPADGRMARKVGKGVGGTPPAQAPGGAGAASKPAAGQAAPQAPPGASASPVASAAPLTPVPPLAQLPPRGSARHRTLGRAAADQAPGLGREGEPQPVDTAEGLPGPRRPRGTHKPV